jgi:DNA-binding response OmpR family regulator
MRRPTLIVAEPEPGQALSTRKLVLETAKFNVLTAHSTDEALDVFQSFPNATCLIAVEGETIDCERILKFVRTIRDDIPLVALSPRQAFRCGFADHHLSSHDPEALVQLMRSLLGDPRKIDPSIYLESEP